MAALAVVAWLCLCIPLRAGWAGEPSVTPAEEALLQQAAAAANDAAAAAGLLAAAETPASSAAIPFAIGAYHLQRQARAEAIEAFRRAVERKPDFQRARLNLAQLLIETGNYGEARTHLTELAGGASSPGAAQVYRLLGYALLADDQPIAAETAYRQALLHEPDHVETRLGLLQALLRQDRLDAAEPLIRADLRRHPAQGDLWSLLAAIATRRGKPQEALVALECARRLGVADATLQAALAELWLAQGMPDEAVALSERLPPGAALDGAQTLGVARALLAAGRADDALRILATAPAPPPAADRGLDAQRHILRAAAHVMREAPDAAEQEYRAVLEDDALNAEALLGLGDVQRRRGKPEEARPLFERASRVAGFEARALLALAQLAVERNDYPAAVAALERALTFDANPAVARYLEQLRALAPPRP